MQAAADLELDVPRDLSVIGITDIQLARESRPALTTVAVPTIEAAEFAVELLLELIETSAARATGGGAPQARVCVTSAPRLVVRASTGPAQKAI
jgi:DNA-binding LacI/PurR family transcriptional regulator